MYSHSKANLFEFTGGLMLRNTPLNMNSIRSINLIISALLTLMDQKPYNKISISDITTKAGVVRSTFYAHFTTKEDVLSYHIFNIFNSKFESHHDSQKLKDSDFVKVYFKIWGEQIELLKLLQENDLLLILNQLDGHFELICKSHFSSNDTCLSEAAIKYSNAFYTDAMASVLKRWVKTGMKESIEEITDIFMELATYDYSS